MTIMHVMKIYLYSDSEETSLSGYKSESRKSFLSCRKKLNSYQKIPYKRINHKVLLK